MSNILVTSASGNIGLPLIPLLLASPKIKSILLPTTNPSRLSSQIPISSRITVLSGSVQDPSFIEHALLTHNVSTVFLCLTGVGELFTTCNFLSSMLRAPCVKHLIYLSACGDLMPASMFHERFGGLMPGHVLVKTIVEQMLAGSKAWTEEDGRRTYTVLRPSLFMGHDLRCKEGMMKGGVYGEPAGPMGVSRVAVEDTALAVLKVPEEPERWRGRKVVVGSRETYTGDDLGRLWSEALGKTVKVCPSDKEGFDRLEKHISEHQHAMWGRDIRLMYELFAKMRFGMTDEEYETQQELLGKEPSNYEEFVKRTAVEWKE